MDKKMIDKVLVFLASALFFGAVGFFVSGAINSNKTAIKPKPTVTETGYTVELLFENDGVKVYRFRDGSRYLYYTDARGRVEWSTTRHDGLRSRSTESHQVETVAEAE